jgi:hypothetical protein
MCQFDSIRDNPWPDSLASMLKPTTAAEEAFSKKFVLRKGHQIRKLKLSAKRSDKRRVGDG